MVLIHPWCRGHILNHRHWPTDTIRTRPTKEGDERDEKREIGHGRKTRRGSGLAYDKDSTILSDEGSNSCATRGIPDKVRVYHVFVSRRKGSSSGISLLRMSSSVPRKAFLRPSWKFPSLYVSSPTRRLKTFFPAYLATLAPVEVKGVEGSAVLEGAGYI